MSDSKTANLTFGKITDASVFEAVFRDWYAPLCRTTYRITGNKEAAEDLVQDIFVKLWDRKDSIDIHISVKSYLYRAAINAGINYKQFHKKLVRPGEEEWAGLPSAANTDDLLHADEADARIREAIDSLPPSCREVFLLSRYEEMSYKEIAETLDISVKTVENQMGKALKVLREKLKPFITELIVLLCFCAGLLINF